MSIDHTYLINHSDLTLAKPVLYLRKYWTSIIESTRRSQKFFYLSWIRRLGKKSIMNHIARGDTHHKVIIIHADALNYEWKDNVYSIISFLKYNIEKYQMIDVFIGEVELLNEYELLLDYVAQEDGVSNCFFTTSHELLLKRYFEMHEILYHNQKILPMEYDEYRTHGKQFRSFVHYVKDTGIPEALSLEKAWHQPIFDYYFQSLVSMILLQDIIGFYSVGNVILLKATFDYILRNAGRSLTYHFIASQLQIQWHRAHHATIKSYCGYFEDVGLFHKIQEYDVHGWFWHHIVFIPIDHGIINFYQDSNIDAKPIALATIIVNRLITLGKSIGAAITTTWYVDIMDYQQKVCYIIAIWRTQQQINQCRASYLSAWYTTWVVDLVSWHRDWYDVIDGPYLFKILTK